VRVPRDMHTLVAVRYHPVRKTCDARLRTVGIAGKMALTAGRRKRLTMRNAMVQHHMLWHA
jgi:hypothetical protein